MKYYLRLLFSAAIAAFTVAMPLAAQANHSWNGYHWARTANPFTLQLGNNLSSSWQPYLSTTSADWSVSDVLDTSVVSGNKAPRTCKPTLGRVEVCNATYGSNGWLGLAQIWVNGDHITQGTVKMNDTYMNRSPYNTAAEKNHVMCQEVGHTLGLGHQDETGLSLGTCMDYSQSLASQHPNQHDYDELSAIYGHLDAVTTLASSPAAALAAQASSEHWGHLVRRSAQDTFEVYESDLGNNQKLLTYVTKAK